MAKGLLPELRRGAETSTKHIEVTTGTQLEHGEKTWTTGQLARDLLQNHLDAETDRFVSRLLAQVTQDPPAGKAGPYSEVRDQLAVLLWRYKKYLEPTDVTAARTWLIQELQLLVGKQRNLKSLLQPELVKLIGGVQVDTLAQRLDDITEEPPTTSYLVRDTGETPPVATWLSYTELQTDRYADTNRYLVVGWKIQDAGSGFDAKLQSLYKSTKSKPYDRGRFGEGMKMSHLHALRHGAKVKVRSGYKVNDGTYHLWQSHPRVAADHSLNVSGIEVTKPAKTGDQTGSATFLDFASADPVFATQLRQEIDPRLGGLARNCLEFSQERYSYFSGYPDVGISTTAPAGEQTVQGLHIAEEVYSHQTTVFAYDFLRPELLGGRDRRNVGRAAKEEIQNFWAQPLPLELVQDCVRKMAALEGRCLSVREESALDMLLSSKKWLHGEDLQRQRTAAEVVATAFVKTFHLVSHQRYLLVRSADADELTAPANTLGIQVKTVGRPYYDNFLKHINELLQSRDIKLYSERTFKKNALLDTRPDKTAESSPERLALLDQLNQLIGRSRLRVENTLRQLGLDPKAINVEPTIQHLVGDAVTLKSDDLIELHWNEGAKRFHLVTQLPKTAETAAAQGRIVQDDLTRLEQRIAVYCLATIERDRPFQSQGEVFEVAQTWVEKWHDRSLTIRHPDLAGLPTDFGHTVDMMAVEEINPFERSKKTRAQDLALWENLRQTRSARTPFVELVEIFNQQDTANNAYNQDLVFGIITRVAFDSDSMTYIDINHTDEATIAHHTTAELEPATTCPRLLGRLEDGRPAVELKTNYYAFPITLPDGAVITCGEDQYLYSAGELYRYIGNALRDGPVIGPYKIQEAYGIILQPTAVAVNFPNQLEPDMALAQLQMVADSVTIQAPDSDAPPLVDSMPTELRTDLPKEFGKEAWNDPVRLVQDIMQNHIDAANGGAVTIEFEVDRSGKRQWVLATAIGRKDVLVGLRISDNGSGYAPHNLHKLGSSSKISPLFRGKYGEGQKMVAAAAARHGLDLHYESVVYLQDKRTRWQANTITIPESVVVRGEPTTVDRVAFQITSQPENKSATISSTTIRIPPGIKLDAAGQKVWSAIAATIHPAQRDAHGHAGIERYVRTLRQPSNKVIDLGYMKILLDEPGAVYENGLRVSTTEKLTVGYDVPSITSTRERNAVDHGRLIQYIESAYSECRDKRFVEALAKRFFTSTWNKLQNSGFGNVVELDQCWQLQSGADTLLSRPLWDEVLSSFRSYLFVHSNELYAEKMRTATTDADYATAATAMHAAERLPKQYGLNVDKFTYEDLSHFLPTSLEVGQAMRGYKVEMSPATASKVYETVAAQAALVKQWLQAEQRNPEADSVTVWTDTAVSRQATDIVLSPLNALTLGTISQSGGRPTMTLNEKLLDKGGRNRLAATTQHELIHHATGQADFDTGFIADLLSMTRFNLERGSSTDKLIRAAQNFVREE